MSALDAGFEDRIRAAYTSGASIREIAARERLSYGCVRQRLLAAGIELRSRGGNTRRGQARKPAGGGE
jgi:Helix-turn-helix domain